MDAFALGYITAARRQDWLMILADSAAMSLWDSRRAQLFATLLAKKDSRHEYEQLVQDLVAEELGRRPLQAEELLGAKALYAVIQGRCELHGVPCPTTHLIKMSLVRLGYTRKHTALGDRWLPPAT